MLPPPDDLANIITRIPTAILDIRYATPHNFTNRRLYIHQTAWLRPAPLEALAHAAEELAANGFKLVVFDAFRPLSVQRVLRTFCNDGDYVLEDSNHCRGITVDISLVNSDDVYLDMGSDYDDFSEKSHVNTRLISREQILNRQLLADAMQKTGFVQHPNEWWHFDYMPSQEWEVVYDETNTYLP